RSEIARPRPGRGLPLRRRQVEAGPRASGVRPHARGAGPPGRRHRRVIFRQVRDITIEAHPSSRVGFFNEEHIMGRWIIAMAIGFLAGGTTSAAVVTKVVDYEFDGTKLKGFLAFDDASKEKKPGVLVFPEWWGLNDYAKTRAKQLAELGYVAF